MWISNAAYLKGREEMLALQATLTAVQATNQQQAATLSWLMVRMTQLEHERAQLIFNFMGIKMPVMQVEKAAESSQTENALNALPNFNDIGDLEAAKQGIGWGDDGSLVYGAQ